MRLTRHAFHAWLSIRDEVPASRAPCVTRVHGVNCVCYMPLAGSHAIRWIRQGREDRWDTEAGQVHVFPADGHDHVLVRQSPTAYGGFALLLPEAHVSVTGTSLSVGDYGLSRRLVIERTSALSDCMRRLCDAMHRPGDDEADAVHGLAATCLELLHEAIGVPSPPWHDHGNSFHPLETRTIVRHIDGHLQDGNHAAEVAVLVGLSSSHFARKFQQTMGMSLQRFVHRRRIRRSLELLRDPARSIPDVAAELGYASRSHFMRMFRGVTGMTPARYRRPLRPHSG